MLSSQLQMPSLPKRCLQSVVLVVTTRVRQGQYVCTSTYERVIQGWTTTLFNYLLGHIHKDTHEKNGQVLKTYSRQVRKEYSRFFGRPEK